MQIITSYGKTDIELNELDDYDLSNRAIEFIKKHINAVELFFGNEVNLTNLSTDQDLIQEFIEKVLVIDKFTEPQRAFALSKYLSEPVTNIEEMPHSSYEFSTNNAEYLVLTDDEATDQAEERAKSYYDDLDPESVFYALEHHGFSEDFIDVSWFNDAMDEHNRSYAEDIQSESASEPYINRLHEEMVDKGVLSEPKWPEEDDFTHEREDFEREEFDEEEPDADDFETDEEYDEAYQEWESAQEKFEKEQDEAEEAHDEEQDRLEEEAQENYENAKSEYKSELESDIDSAIDEFVEALNGDYDDGLAYFKDQFGNDEVGRMILDNNLADKEALGLQLLEDEGRGYFLDSYSGSEDFQTSTYRNEKYEFYFYRTN